MKRLLVFMVAIAASFSMFAQDNDENVNKETRNIKEFDKIKVTRGINVTLIKGEEPKAEINIVNAPTSDVIIENDQNELEVKMRTRIYDDVSVQVYVTYTKDIREITLGSGGSVNNEGVLTGKVLVLDSGLDSVIDLNVDVEDIEASVSAARITLEGYAKSLEVKASTGGKFQGQNMEVKKGYVTANTGGIATVKATELLN
ncbi:GIN domain-containing protein, partial [Marinilabilia sp.]